MEYSRINMGRRQQQLERVGIYDKEKLRLVAIASDLLRCSEVSRQEGLLALEHECERFFGDSEFLPFAIRLFCRLSWGRRMWAGLWAGW